MQNNDRFFQKCTKMVHNFDGYGEGPFSSPGTIVAEGSELSEKIGQLKMKSTDGKFYATDVADQEQLFRLVQSIPSPKVEPIKLWIARVASERIDEMIDPEISIDRAIDMFRRKGYSEEWINQRMQGKKERKKLTDEWKRVGAMPFMRYGPG